jgi:replicative DNA helicase
MDEAAVVAAMILEGQRIDDVVGRLAPMDFTNDILRELFVQLIDLHDASKPTDILSLTSELRSNGSFKRIGVGTLARLHDSIGHAGNIGFHADQVRAAATLRKLGDIGTKLVELNTSDKPDDVVDWLDTELSKLRSNDAHHDSTVALADCAMDLVAEIDAAADTGLVRGIRTGLECFDRVNGGFQNGTLNILTARPSNGKSVLGLQWAQSIGTGFEYANFEGGTLIETVQSPKSTLFVSLEMTKAELSARALASVAQVDGRRINSYRVTAGQREELRRAAEAMKSTIQLWQPPRATTGAIRARSRIHKRSHGLELLVVDYLQLIDSERGQRHERETYRIGDLCRDLKALAMELDIPVVVLCQLNREAENQLPTLAQLADSGKIEQHADTITAIHRQRGESQEAKLVILKWRNGQTPEIDITFDRQHCRFESAQST